MLWQHAFKRKSQTLRFVIKLLISKFRVFLMHAHIQTFLLTFLFVVVFNLYSSFSNLCFIDAESFRMNHSAAFCLLYSVKDASNKEVLGILVSYRVKVKLVVSRGG